MPFPIYFLKSNIIYIIQYIKLRVKSNAILKNEFLVKSRGTILYKGGARLLYEDFLRNRISTLRMQKGVSARDMSLSIGQNGNFINSIESGKSLPSIPSFFYICEYFEISPKQFFDEEEAAPGLLNDLIRELKKLDETQLESLMPLVKSLAQAGKKK